MSEQEDTRNLWPGSASNGVLSIDLGEPLWLCARCDAQMSDADILGLAVLVVGEDECESPRHAQQEPLIHECGGAPQDQEYHADAWDEGHEAARNV